MSGDSYSPWEDLAARQHLTYVRCRLPIADAWYLPDVPGIAIDDRLTRTERRCALAHELAHIDLEHHHQAAGNGQGTSRIARRNEAEADQLAARRLITLEDLVEHVPGASCRWELAERLDVTEHVLAVRHEHLHPSERAYLKQRLERGEL